MPGYLYGIFIFIMIKMMMVMTYHISYSLKTSTAHIYRQDILKKSLSFKCFNKLRYLSSKSSFLDINRNLKYTVDINKESYRNILSVNKCNDRQSLITMEYHSIDFMSFKFSIPYKSSTRLYSTVSRDENQQVRKKVYKTNSTNSLSDFKKLPEETLYILDGTSMFFNAYYSKEATSRFAEVTFTPSLSATMRKYIINVIVDEKKNPSDESLLSQTTPLPAGALAALASQFARFIKDVKPRYLVAAFDAGKKTFRHKKYPAYKQNREKKSEELLSQLLAAPLIIDSLGCPCFQIEGFEADDVMATLSKWARERGLNVVHVSSDKDMLQLVEDRVHVMRPIDRQLICTDDIINEYGIHPKQFRDYQALMGDTADNIPGVKGVGPKTASALIKHFETIEVLYSKLGLIPGKVSSSLSSSSSLTELASLEALESLEKSLKGVKVKALNVFKNLQSISYEELLLFRELVSLDSNVQVLPPILSEQLSLVKDNYDSNNQKTKYLDLIKRIQSGDDGEEGFGILLQSIFDNNEKYSVVSSTLVTSSSSSTINPIPRMKFSSTSLRYTGERPHCSEVMSLLGEAFVSSLAKLRSEYHKLDREI